jgi:PadR family transcriptional regulator, regulatory protein PadR
MAGADRSGPRGRGRQGAGDAGCGGGEGWAGGVGPGGGRYRRSVMEAALLASLAESTSHGYELIDQLVALASDLVCIDAGSMYRLLRSMEEEGLVASSWETPESGPGRRVYVITDQGIEALEAMAHSLSQRATTMQHLADYAGQAVAKARAPKK